MGMAAFIEFVCIADHGSRKEPSITLEQRAWAYCSSGANDAHVWARIDPTAVETVRSRPGSGQPHLAPDHVDKGSFASSPGR
jgi:hypothetical protein